MLIFCQNKIENVFAPTCWWSWRWFWRCRESRSPPHRTWYIIILTMIMTIYYHIDNDYHYPHHHPPTCWKGSWSPSALLETSWMLECCWSLLLFTLLILSLFLVIEVDLISQIKWETRFVEIQFCWGFLASQLHTSLIQKKSPPMQWILRNDQFSSTSDSSAFSWCAIYGRADK